MKIGVPREIKVLEYRVGMVPAGVRELVHDGHDVFVETGAGEGIGMTDGDYEVAGATVLPDAKAVFAGDRVAQPRQVIRLEFRQFMTLGTVKVIMLGVSIVVFVNAAPIQLKTPQQSCIDKLL